MKKFKFNKDISHFMLTDYTTIALSKLSYEKVTYNFGSIYNQSQNT